jgi:ribosomal protein S18 acetylase RimI-like enzyme
MSTKQQKKREAREAKDALERARAAKRKAAMYVLDSPGASPVARDVMEGFKPFGVFDRNGLRCSIDFACPGHPSWSAEAARATFELTRSNMRALYEAAPEWGWKEGAKRAEMLDPENRYLLAREAASDAGGGSGGAAAAPSAEGGGGAAAAAAPSAEGDCAAVAGEILGFVSFRFVLEGDFDVLYVYELQMGPKAQRKGLGKHLMQICELVARKSGMQWFVVGERGVGGHLCPTAL